MKWADDFVVSFSIMKLNTLLYIVLSVMMPGLAQAQNYLLTSGEWAVPRNAASVQSMPALQSAMRDMQAKPASTLRIRYPGGDVGTLWANELRSWLVALGLESQRIELVRGSAAGDTLVLEVVEPVSPPRTLTNRE